MDDLIDHQAVLSVEWDRDVGTPGWCFSFLLIFVFGPKEHMTDASTQCVLRCCSTESLAQAIYRRVNHSIHSCIPFIRSVSDFKWFLFL